MKEVENEKQNMRTRKLKHSVIMPQENSYQLKLKNFKILMGKLYMDIRPGEYHRKQTGMKLS